MERSEAENREQVIQQYLTDLRSKTNHKNLHAYMDSFLKYGRMTGYFHANHFNRIRLFLQPE